MSNFTDKINDEFDVHITELQIKILTLRNEIKLIKEVQQIINRRKSKNKNFVLRQITFDGIDVTKDVKSYMELENK